MAEAIAGLIQALSPALGLLALATAAYAGYELVTIRDWRRTPAGVAARLWVLVLLGIVAVESVVFESNAVLLAAYRLGVSLRVVQVFVLGSLTLAVVAWAREP